MAFDDETERYPRRIEKLFTPRLPLLYKKPVDYPPEKRRTTDITPVSLLKLEIEKYKSEFQAKEAESEPPKKSKKELHNESMQRQLRDWEDTEAFSNNEFLRDPLKTVFVARLYYTLSELDLSKLFNRFGSIDTIRVVRDKTTGLSRGYGFVAFERDMDAQTCIRQLASTGLDVERPTPDVKSRKILVDIERGRTIRNWRPRRLGGGLGGRGYTKISAYGNKYASAAASGRRMNLPLNPYAQASSHTSKRPAPDSGAPPKRQGPSANYYSSSSSYSTPQADAASSRTPQSIRDKYAKYQTGGQSLGRSARSIRSIRGND